MTSYSQGQRLLSVLQQFRHRDHWGFVIGITLLGVFLSASAQAATVTVNNPLDVVDAAPGNGVCETAPGNGVCTLRAAIEETNALPGDDTIILPPNTYLLTQVAELTITGNLTIIGGEASTTIIDGNKSARPNSGVLSLGTTVIISGVTIRNGESKYGGGIYNYGTLTLTNSTVSGNSANSGGGIYNVLRDTRVFSSTIANNQAGGGVRSVGFGATVTFQNTILARNLPYDCAGIAFLSGGNNLVGTCTVNSGTAPTVGDPHLGPLQNNGGPTQTHALLSGSPAIDAGNPNGCLDQFGAPLLTDQRGATRHIDGNNDGKPRCDIGAVEFGSGFGVPADFNGDGISDLVVFRGGAWLFHDFATSAQNGGVWTGSGAGCIPVAMDYDGDGKTNFTQLCNGAWHFYNANGSYNKGIWTGGVAGDRPVPADYDGDGTDDVVVYREGAWLFYNFSTGAFDAAKSRWTGGAGSCIPAPMDYDGDGIADFTQLCSGAWHFYNDNGGYNKGIWTGGVAGDIPVPADYDGNGTDDVIVFRGGAWLFHDFATGAFDSVNNTRTGAPPHWTGGTSLPAPLDYDGDGKADFTVYSGGPWHFYSSNGTYNKGIWTGGVAGDRALSRRLLP